MHQLPVQPQHNGKNEKQNSIISDVRRQTRRELHACFKLDVQPENESRSRVAGYFARRVQASPRTRGIYQRTELG